MLLQPALGAPGRSAARETLEDAVCLAALERRFGAALRDGAQPGEASAQAMRDYLCGPLSGAVYSLVMTLDVELCVLAGIVPGALGMQLCTQVSEALRAALPESTPVRVEPSVSADAGVIGAAACSAAADGGAARRGLAQGCAAKQRMQACRRKQSKKRIARRSGACYNRCA